MSCAPSILPDPSRLHLLCLSTEATSIIATVRTTAASAASPLAHSVATAPPQPDTIRTHTQVQQIIRRRYEAIQALAAKGLNGQQIARELGLHRHTVERNLRLPQCPERARHPRTPNLLDPYEPYLLTRWAEGYHNALGLWREIVAQGFPGTSRTVSRFVTYLRQQQNNPEGSSLGHAPAGLAQRRGLTVREAVSLLVRPLEQLTPDQQLTRTSICGAHAEIALTDSLLSDFKQLFRDRDPEALAAWLTRAEHSGVPELRAFVIRVAWLICQRFRPRSFLGTVRDPSKATSTG